MSVYLDDMDSMFVLKVIFLKRIHGNEFHLTQCNISSTELIRIVDKKRDVSIQWGILTS